MITSNLVFSKWDLIFKDPMTTAAAIDRVVHHSVILELNVPSYRAEIAQRARRTKISRAEEDSKPRVVASTAKFSFTPNCHCEISPDHEGKVTLATHARPFRLRSIARVSS
jgi:hypothetical protein